MGKNMVDTLKKNTSASTSAGQARGSSSPASKRPDSATGPDARPLSDAALRQPELYINRYTSLLEFNRRVLEYAKDASVPLLERLKYLCISSSNLDEFFEIRIALLKQSLETGSIQSGPDNKTPGEILEILSGRVEEFVDEQYRILNEELIPELADNDIHFLKRTEWSKSQEKWLRSFFKKQLTPILSPIGLDPAHPFPRVLNKSLNFIVSLKGKDAFGRDSVLAVVQAPRVLPRVIQLPQEVSDGHRHVFVFLSSIIHAYVDDLFPGMKSTGCYQFRVTRNSDLFVDEEEIDNLARALEGELSARRYGAAVRLEVADNCPEKLRKYLLQQFELGLEDVYQANGPVNLNRLLAIYDLVDKPGMKYPGFISGLPPRVAGNKDIFDAINQGDILLHHPYEAFLPVLDLVKQSASDPDVLAIKQTLYRTGPDSAVVDALVEAARAGKEVTVIIELRARFDEAENIELANRLDQAGAHVVYGVVGYKTHAKMLLVIRRGPKKSLQRFVHLGTGNYHPRTARLYTDYGLLTCDPLIGEDVHNVFMQLTSLGKVPTLNKLLQSPFTLHPKLIEWINREAQYAAEGKPARIIIKVNSLTEPKAIKAMYRASRAGVSIDLIVRGMCCLRPGIPGVSDNIRVRSIIGRFLEHTRVYYFHNDGKEALYCASADLMERNMFRRVEVAFPIENEESRKQIMEELDTCLKDNTQAWILDSEGNYVRASAGGSKPVTAQMVLLDRLAESS
ncbi:MAG: polyphosphate kinase 1 [Gammaproteobacteria bacterium]|nr:polyphosphate kinase 1 [Gammaproteobacteria bacterium]